MRLLFVCSRNQWRSPTAERVVGRWPGVQARSAGTSASARRTVNEKDLQWADLILVMEKKHRDRIISAFPEHRGTQQIHVLDIPDDYEFMDPQLVDQIEAVVKPLIDAFVARRS